MLPSLDASANWGSLPMHSFVRSKMKLSFLMKRVLTGFTWWSGASHQWFLGSMTRVSLRWMESIKPWNSTSNPLGFAKCHSSHKEGLLGDYPNFSWSNCESIESTHLIIRVKLGWSWTSCSIEFLALIEWYRHHDSLKRSGTVRLSQKTISPPL